MKSKSSGPSTAHEAAQRLADSLTGTSAGPGGFSGRSITATSPPHALSQRASPATITELTTLLERLNEPLCEQAQEWTERNNRHYCRIVTRLAPGITLEQAQRSLNSLNACLQPTGPDMVLTFLKRLIGHYPQVRRGGDMEGAAEDWIAIFSSQPAGAMALAYRDYITSTERFAPSPGQLLAMVTPHRERLERKAAELSTAIQEARS